MRVLGATSNKYKLAEIRSVAGRFGVEVVSPEELEGEAPDVEETGETYEDNARLKSRAYFEWSGIPSLADDSGLEVLALDNRPGVHSARYAGESTSFSEKMRFLLGELHEIEQRTGIRERRAAFQCCLVLSYSGGELVTSASLPGHILDEPRGDGGFGYDPIVFIDEFGATLAEVDYELTVTRGFRARAAENLFAKLASIQSSQIW